MKSIYCKSKNFLYTPIAKCANTNWKHIIYELEYQREYTDDSWRIHLPHHFNIIENPKEIPKDCFKFVFVRNPYTRILSTFLNKIIYRKQIEWLKSLFLDYMGVKWTDATALGNVLVCRASNKKFLIEDSAETFLKFLQFLKEKNKNGLFTEEHVCPQWFIAKTEVINYDFVGRMENLSEDFKYLSNKLSIDVPFPSPSKIDFLPTNATKLQDKYYTPEAISIVNELYKKDFKQFEYEMI